MFRKMHMGKDMILAEAMIPGAFAAITELQIGVVGVGAAADGALVVVALLLLLLAHGLAEVHRLAGVEVLPDAQEPLDLRPDKDQEVQQRSNGKDNADPVAYGQGGDHNKGIVDAVNDGQPLHLDGDDEEQHHLHIREENGEGQEQGQIDEMRSGQSETVFPGDETGNDGADDGEQHAGDVIERKPCGAPFPFQS